MLEWANCYGPIFSIRLFRQIFVVISDLEAIQKVLRDRPDGFRRWRKIPEIAADIGAHGLFSAEGASWKRQRKFVTQALNPDHVREFTPRLEAVTGRLRRKWWRVALSEQPIDIHVDLKRFAVDVTSGLAFGQDWNTLEERFEPLQKHLDVLWAALGRRQTALFPYWRYIKLPVDRETDAAASEVRRIIEGLISNTRKQIAIDTVARECPRNLLESLVVARERGESDLTDEEIAGNMLTLLLAGEDTTANTISWIVYLLARHPEVQARVQEEVDQVLGATEIDWKNRLDVLHKLPYLQAVTNEAMRLYPVGGEFFLEPTSDVEIMGFRVARGTPILALASSLGTQEKHFQDAGCFLPERWLVPDGEIFGALKSRAFMPFGSGPRLCPGRLLATLEINMVVTMLCQDFELQWNESMPVPKAEYAITVGPDRVVTHLRPRRAIRFGVELESREAERRLRGQDIGFPNRRLGDRRGRTEKDSRGDDYPSG